MKLQAYEFLASQQTSKNSNIFVVLCLLCASAVRSILSFTK